MINYSLKKFFRSFDKKEKITLLIATVIFLSAIFGKNIYLRITSVPMQPKPGGKFIEGILAQTDREVEKSFNSLVNFSLLYLDENMTIQNGLASSYEILDGGKKYLFTLKNGINAKELAPIFNAHTKIKNNSIKAESTDENKLQITLEKIYTPIIYYFTEPIYPYGPYKIASKTSESIELIRNEKFIMHSPYIEKIKIKIYRNLNNLEKAYRSQEIDSAITSLERKNTNKYILELQKRAILFFNLEQIQDKNVRTKLKNNQNIDGNLEINLTVLDTPTLFEKAQKIKDQFAILGAVVNIQTISQNNFEDLVLLDRLYQALLVGIDFGRNPDPYPFWHSSNITADGQNYSQYFNKKTDRMLEDSRLEIDNTKRQSIYTQIENIINNDSPVIEYDKEKVEYFVDNKIKGILINQGVAESDRFSNVWDWYIKEERKK
ncbi:hypothetical protein COY43_02755 [Candidatus Berkelbacteria bacterium CG_4_10_14_0_8_um_filter_35_9_33_8]|nr:MAG: hypothetical protein COX10_02635 [Candidatus Berkelbacteria bacterium CG23_combo_of_CG06-09_8_20_14_all_33_15]PIS08658.1 MAG: hypothetical protein COT76_00065 [Candidatus Berkelbacteria bacterium CG10_big_fil_rev_8_21_14_0_10_33_10]PIZ28021.1 MAG: hypothetical protein COY43_02755 [Candidatus Berkelbacteria bacterium CG_4_10_14_0_8_um_filter_35_9_33_8]